MKKPKELPEIFYAYRKGRLSKVKLVLGLKSYEVLFHVAGCVCHMEEEQTHWPRKRRHQETAIRCFPGQRYFEMWVNGKYYEKNL
jgi:hypothetical protein